MQPAAAPAPTSTHIGPSQNDIVVFLRQHSVQDAAFVKIGSNYKGGVQPGTAASPTKDAASV
jgi:hypothetical protein